eukprot:TRINITY_DN1644_c1_g1_i4.p1 TRINITY_DN1644_c1_g1~~TRINITY_DN1644_c1_g1_i4.p1  ORF type:complete len:207 (-),score=-23.42 TRINITY_DN1644_c1_g1_i4:102-722(-)
MNHQKVANSSYSILWHSYIIINMTLTIIISVILIILSSLIQNEQKHINRVQQIQLEFCCYETMIKFATVTLSQCKNQKNPTQICKKSNIEICMQYQHQRDMYMLSQQHIVQVYTDWMGNRQHDENMWVKVSNCPLIGFVQLLLFQKLDYYYWLNILQVTFTKKSQFLIELASSICQLTIQYNPHNQVVKYFFDLYIIVYKVNCLQY